MGLVNNYDSFGQSPNEEALPTMTGGKMTIQQNEVGGFQTTLNAFIEAVKGNIITFPPSNNAYLVKQATAFGLSLLNRIQLVN